MIIDNTFFQDGLLRIEGLAAYATPSPTNEAIIFNIESFIDQYEPEYMCKLLGEELYREYLQNRDGGSQIWNEFEAILIQGDSLKRSPIANYVYFHMLRSYHTNATINGVRIDDDYGILKSPERKMISAWNDMCKMNRKLFRWLENANLKGWEFDMELLETINNFGI